MPAQAAGTGCRWDGVRRVASVAVLLLLVLASPAAAHGGAGVNHADTARDLADVDIAAVARTAQRAAEPNVAADLEALPFTWSCGERSSDSTSSPVFDPELPQIHVVYAYAGSSD